MHMYSRYSMYSMYSMYNGEKNIKEKQKSRFLSAEAEFLDVIRTKSSRIVLLAIHSHPY